MPRPRTSLASLAALAAAAIAFASPARAADCDPPNRLSTCVDADVLWPHAGPARFVAIGGTETTARGQVGFGLAASWAHRPIVLHAPSSSPGGVDTPAVDDLLDATFLWSIGVTDRLELDAAVPTTLRQTGPGVSTYTSSHTQDLARTAVRDARVGATWAIVPHARVARADGLGLAARAELALPTGTADAFAGDRGFVFVPSLAADFRHGPLHAGAELGGRVRKTTDLAGTRVGPQLLGAIGAGVDVWRELLSVQVEAWELVTMAEQATASRDPATFAIVEAPNDARLVPGEWMASLRSAPLRGGDLSVFAGAGTALASSVTAPAWRATLGVRWAPLARDTDGDLVLDRDDRCPDAREDRDGFQDDDGCPDPDNDRDGIPDANDRCRDEAETVDGFQDEDGCPDLDDDGDGIPDDVDQCRMAAEDRDGFQDDDGCPDPDNDRDGIPDANDRCPNAPEDVDGHLDEDGCPDPDDDGDGIADASDLCPQAAEDRDGFRDDDGCPDPDDDEDGVPDAADRCPREPEMIDGDRDEDGCAEPGATSRVRWSGDAIVVDRPTRFAPGASALPPAMKAELAMIAQLARGRAPLARVFVETYADRPGESDAATALAARRADAIRAELARHGLAVGEITAVVGDLAARRPAGAPPFDVHVERAKPARGAR